MSYPLLSLFQNHKFHQNWFHQMGLMIIFPTWPVLGLFNIVKLYRLPHVTISSSRFETSTTKSRIHALFRTSSKISFGPCSPRYSNSPQVSCLGMNLRRGWNPNLVGSYLPEYRECEAEFWTHCKSGVYIQPVKGSAPYISPIPRYRKCTKTYHF